jgi:hypothetical protein
MVYDNPFIQLFEQVQVRIQNECTSIRFIDEDKGQLDHYQVKPAVSFPCVLMDMDFDFTDIGDNVQEAQGQLVIRLAYPPYSSANNIQLDNTLREKAISYFALEYELYTALQGWQPDGFSYLCRRKATTERREDNIRVREIRFDVEFTDYTAQPQKTIVAGNAFGLDIQPQPYA